MPSLDPQQRAREVGQILTLQQRARELGRIRIGQVVPTSNGKTRPTKLDRFRLTSPSKALLDQVATLYGGTVTEWQPQGGGAQQWEVITTATRLPVFVPPQPVSQFFELWTSGGCKRRCNGVTEFLTDQSCLCSPDPADRVCKPTTRLNVILRDVPGIGVWRLETHSYYAAVELPQAAMFLAQAGGYVNGYLSLEARRVIREVPDRENGGVKPQTFDFMVPILEIDVTPAELMAGKGAITAAAVDARPAPAAIEAAPAAVQVPDYVAQARAAVTLDEVRAIWVTANRAGHLTPQIGHALQEIAAAHQSAQSTTTNVPVLDQDALWQQIVALAGDLGMSLADIDTDIAKQYGGIIAGDATPDQLAAYLGVLKQRKAAAT